MKYTIVLINVYLFLFLLCLRYEEPGWHAGQNLTTRRKPHDNCKFASSQTFIARTCGRLTDCFRIRENKPCIRIHRNRGNANWFTSVESCEKAGGRLLWLYDTNITEFMETLDNLTRLECADCQFLWIGLVQSVSQDEKYFWKRPKNETVAQCQDHITCRNCSINVTESECELLGCCYRDQSCRYPGNVIQDLQNEYDFHGRRMQSQDDYRHCVGFQLAMNGSWIMRTRECITRERQRNGYICEYKCDMDWPVPTSRTNISMKASADTGCAGLKATVSPLGADNCSTPGLYQCNPIPGRNSCIITKESNDSTNWFNSAKACDDTQGRLLWLYDKNITKFMKSAATGMPTACPSCTFMWIGLMQSTFHDDNFFWKRTRNETIKQCEQGLSNIACAFNVSEEHCDLLGCCFNDSLCFYPGNVDIDRKHEYKEINQRNNSSPGYRRCVGLHKPTNTTAWTLSVEDCTKSISYIHGYFCEHKCGSDWPVPVLKPKETITQSLIQNIATSNFIPRCSILLASPVVTPSFPITSSVSTSKDSTSVSSLYISTSVISSTLPSVYYRTSNHLSVSLILPTPSTSFASIIKRSLPSSTSPTVFSFNTTIHLSTPPAIPMTSFHKINILSLLQTHEALTNSQSLLLESSFKQSLTSNVYIKFVASSVSVTHTSMSSLTDRPLGIFTLPHQSKHVTFGPEARTTSRVSSTSTTDVQTTDLTTNARDTVTTPNKDVSKRHKASDSGGNLSTGAVVGIAVASAVVVLLAVVVIGLCLRKIVKALQRD